MGSILPSRSLARASLGLLLIASPFLPGACGGSTTITFVGSSGGSGGEGGGDGEGGEGGDIGGAASGGAETGGTGTGAADTGGTGGTVILPSCGNGEAEEGEACDDDGDSANCDFDCTLAECGDGYTNDAAREACDEGGETASCDDDCTDPDCGDGVVNEATGEECDDDNNEDGDGCSAQCVREILILGDGVSEGDAIQVLRDAGFAVALAPVLEYEFDGTNPTLNEFCGVIQFNATYTTAMTADGQTALVDYVEAGGAFMGMGASLLESTNYGLLNEMSDLILLEGYSGGTTGTYVVTTPGLDHQITTGLPASFVHNAGGERGTCKAGSTALLSDDVSEALCVDEEVGAGRAATFGNVFGLFGARPLLGIEMGTLLVQAANWLCGTNHDFPFAPMTVGSTEVVSRFGYQVQCQEWVDSDCVRPYIAMNADHVTAPVPHCIDDETSLRPIWFGEAALQAAAWCWIATANSTPVTAATDGATGHTSGGWMYAGSDSYYYPVCDDGSGRHYSTVEIPSVGPQNWSFDDFGYVRAGSFMRVGCTW